jgi:predicted acylesterase/phospholipase RssA
MADQSGVPFSATHVEALHPMAAKHPKLKKAITLAGGGPAAGLHIGALQRLEEADKEFGVWALSCIGAWVGIVYNQFDGPGKAKQTYKFFRDGVFRDDRSYDRFPVNSVFGPDYSSNTRALIKFLTDPKSYENIVLPSKILGAAQESLAFLATPRNWDWRRGDFNHWMLNQVLAVNPFSRFLTSAIHLSPVNGLAKIYYPDSTFLSSIKVRKLFDDERPFMYHNAWNLSKKKLDLFANLVPDNPKKGIYKDMSLQSLCACSALPYVEPTLEIDGDVYCEGALIDTVNFEQLLEDHADLDEIWVSRIVDVQQVRAPENIKDALGNLCMLFAGAVGDDDVRLFKFHAQRRGWRGKIIEIRPSTNISFDWNHRNLEQGSSDGYNAVDYVLRSVGIVERIASTLDGPLTGFRLLRDPAPIPKYLKSFAVAWESNEGMGGADLLPRRDGEDAEDVISNLIASDQYAGKGLFCSTKPSLQSNCKVWHARTKWQDDGGRTMITHYLVTEKKNGGHIAFALARNIPDQEPTEATLNKLIEAAAKAAS